MSISNGNYSTSSGHSITIKKGYSSNTNTTAWDTDIFHRKNSAWNCSPGSDRDGKCSATNRDGDPCGLDAAFDDDKCHWHTEEQCFRMTDDGSSCELPGSRDDGACHIHTRGCNESLTHSALEKACFHGMKFPYRMLGLHPDTKRSRGPFSIQPQMAAEVAARVGKGFLEAMGEEYDREESQSYFMDKIVEKAISDQSVIDSIKSKFEFLDDERDLQILKKGIEKAWNQVNDKEHHADGARTALVTAEYFLDEEIEVEV